MDATWEELKTALGRKNPHRLEFFVDGLESPLGFITKIDIFGKHVLIYVSRLPPNEPIHIELQTPIWKEDEEEFLFVLRGRRCWIRRQLSPDTI